ncbi:uncharacterized protein LOC132303125 [Cornus florida]|uniref:uncharacterized protein LOC132303125 n=1 Tax=Cornus florida TaxID=4283 RepID=UPI00289AE4BD|nr:uncharacterized protein LOC132303125 [Cornus florida]
MSGTPSKRLHEEGVGGSGGGGGGGGPGHSSSSKHPQYDSVPYSSVGPKLTSSAMNEYHNTSYDIGQEARMPKIPRADSRDADRRSPLLPMYRVPSSSNDLQHSDHSIALENRLEIRDSKDNSRDVKVENRDSKAEPKELYHGIKGDKDVRVEGRGDDNKEYPDHEYKGDAKTEKDVYGAVSAHLNSKDSKEHHRGKRYSDAPGGMADTWHAWHANLYGPVEVGKEGLSTEEKERDYVVEAHEAVGENKVDLKAEDKFKEKDRKRKEGKHREWGERDRRNNLQVGSGSGEGKESIRDEREAERWERERKDLLKDKEKLKEREKDHFKREGWNGTEKEVSHNEKEPMDVSGRTLDPENLMLEQKKQKDHDSWKNVEREARERRKERDADVEGERPEKRSRCYDKESDDGCVDAEGGTEKEREAFNYGVQQRKRMLRPRGSPQMANREPRFRPRTQDNDGTQGKLLIEWGVVCLL